MTQPILKPMTLSALEDLEDQTGQRFELWQGRPVGMTGGTLKHNLIALGLRDALKPQIKSGCQITVSDVKLRLNEADDNAYPDVMVVCDPAPSLHQTSPVLLAEVLSDSSVRRDKVDKHRAYIALESLHVYLILSQQDVEVDVYQRANDWQRERYQGLDAVIDIPALEIRLALGDIYADVLEDLGY